MTPDWILKVIVDRGPGAYYRFWIRGENLNYAPGHPDREFQWSVRDVDDPRFDKSNAIYDAPTCRLGDLQAGQKFRHVGYPDKFTVYVARGNGWYSSVKGYDGGPWHSPDTQVVVL